MATLKVYNGGGGYLVLEMPGATSIRYAAKRVAEAIGLDPNAGDFELVHGYSNQPIPQKDIVAQYDGHEVGLLLRGRLS